MVCPVLNLVLHGNSSSSPMNSLGIGQSRVSPSIQVCGAPSRLAVMDIVDTKNVNLFAKKTAEQGPCRQYRPLVGTAEAGRPGLCFKEK